MTRRAAGFTLVEMAVALGLAGLVSLLLLGGLRMTVAGTEKLSRNADRVDARFTLAALLRRSLEATGPVPGFDGHTDRLSFVAAADTGSPGLYRFELTLDKHRVVLSRSLASAGGEPRRDSSVLAERVRRFRLDYFGATGPSEPAGWHESWQSQALPPQLVRVTLDTADGEPRPPLVIRLWGAG